MKKIIDKKVYNTKTATEIAEYGTNYNPTDFNFCVETLYKSPKGQYFLHGKGGAASKYAVMGSGYSSEGEDIKLFSERQAINWLEETNNVEALEKNFKDQLEEG